MFTKTLIFSTLIIMTLSIIGCAGGNSDDIKKYKDKTPLFSIPDFFNGQLCAKGLVRNRDQSINRKFIANIKASSNQDRVSLDEIFLFDDGEVQTRLWQFVKLAKPINSSQGETWSGEAGDVLGKAFIESLGDSLHLIYKLKVQRDDDYIILDMDDWLHLIDDNTLMGSTDMSKWGFNVGRIDIVIEKNACLQNISLISDPK